MLCFTDRIKFKMQLDHSPLSQMICHQDNQPLLCRFTLAQVVEVFAF